MAKKKKSVYNLCEGITVILPNGCRGRILSVNPQHTEIQELGLKLRDRPGQVGESINYSCIIPTAQVKYFDKVEYKNKGG